MTPKTINTFYELTNTELQALAEKTILEGNSAEQTSTPSNFEDSTESVVPDDELRPTIIGLDKISLQLRNGIHAIDTASPCIQEILGIKEDLDEFCNGRYSELTQNDIARFKAISSQISCFELTRTELIDRLTIIVEEFEKRLQKQNAIQLLMVFKQIPLNNDSSTILDKIIELVRTKM